MRWREAQLGLWDWDLKRKTAVWSARTANMVGGLPETQELDSETWQELVHPEDRPYVSELLNRHFEGRSPYFEAQCRTKGGPEEWRWVQARGKVVEYDGDGRPERMSGTVLDVTDSKRLQEQLIQSQKMEAIGTLAGGIAHDFNNLLHVIQGYADIILLGIGKGDHGYTELHEIKGAARRAAELTQSLLTFGRRIDGQLRPVDLNIELEQIARMLRRTIPKMIRIQLTLAEDLRPINADPAQLHQVVMNLAVNARDAMPNGGKLRLRRQTCSSIKRNAETIQD